MTDHRINLTLINELDNILDGDIGEIVERLRTWDETRRLGEEDGA